MSECNFHFISRNATDAEVLACKKAPGNLPSSVIVVLVRAEVPGWGNGIGGGISRGRCWESSSGDAGLRKIPAGWEETPDAAASVTAPFLPARGGRGDACSPDRISRAWDGSTSWLR